MDYADKKSENDLNRFMITFEAGLKDYVYKPLLQKSLSEPLAIIIFL